MSTTLSSIKLSFNEEGVPGLREYLNEYELAI